MDYVLKCLGCGHVYKRSYDAQVCDRCGGLLEVAYKGNPKRLSNESGRPSIWEYADFLPKGEYKRWAVGGTRLLRSQDLGNVYMKMELDNPTRSFKDRGSVIEIGKAKEYGFKRIVCASTGNMAYSLSYYAKLAGMRAKVFISGDANPDKIRYIRDLHDADITRVNGDFNAADRFARRYAKSNDVFLTGDYCYRKEGQKTLVYEIFGRLIPDYLIVPVGNATLLSAVFKAIREYKAAGIIKRAPKVVAVEAKGCSPLVKAFNSNKELRYEAPKTKADAIAVGFPVYGNEAINEMRSEGSLAIAVSDKEMGTEQKKLHDEQGIIAELGGVASLAALRKMDIGSREKAVAIISGGNM